MRTSAFSWLVVVCLSGHAALVAAAGQPAAQEPTFTYPEASGCEGLLMYAWNDERTEVLTVRVDSAIAPLRRGTTTFQLDRAPDGVAVRVEMTPDERSNMQFCSKDGRTPDDKPTYWVAQSGTLKVTMTPRPGVPFTSVTVSLEDLVVGSPDGGRARARRDIKFTAAVAIAAAESQPRR